MASFSTVKDYTMYTNKAFDGGSAARKVLEHHLSDKAAADREAVVKSLEEGSSSFSHELNIPLDSLWTSDFHLEPSKERSADGFFYKPYEAALKTPQSNYQNLAYWSRPFCLEDDT